jgi:uncharacterized protein (TIGR02284 family)
VRRGAANSASSNIEDDMDETQQRNGEVLDWLLQGANDSAQGFRQGSDLARNPKLKTLFAERAEQREALAGKIADEVRSFAQQPPSQGGTVIGEAHKAFTFVRDAISHGSDKGLVEELLRRERALADKFQSAIDDPKLPSHARGVAAAGLPGFAETTAELTAIDAEFAGGPEASPATTGHFALTDGDNSFLEIPSGSAVLSTGAAGTETSIQRTQDTVVRIGIQAVAVATSQGGSLSVTIEAGEVASKGHDGPAALEHHLAVGQSVEVLVRAELALAVKAYATPNQAELLRTVVWSMDLRDAVPAPGGEPQAASVDAANTAAAQDYARVTT